MKSWKIDIINAIAKEAESCRIISFKETVAKLGYKHIKTEDIKSMIPAIKTAMEDYKPVILTDRNGHYNSLFCDLYFIDKTTVFEGVPEEEK